MPTSDTCVNHVDRATLDALGCPNSGELGRRGHTSWQHGEVGKGIGVAALQALTAQIRRDPTVPLMGLTTSVANVHAHHAFERAGFRIARQYDPNGLGPCHLMVLDLQINANPAGKSR
jgi:RimJ/RimL family protein N-acetyltransferase